MRIFVALSLILFLLTSCGTAEIGSCGTETVCAAPTIEKTVDESVDDIKDKRELEDGETIIAPDIEDVEIVEDEDLERIVGHEVTIHYFYNDYCPHCKKAEEFLVAMEKIYPYLTVNRYDTLEATNNDVLDYFSELNDIKTQYIPTIIVCDEYMQGYQSHEITGVLIEEFIYDATMYDCNNLEIEVKSNKPIVSD